MGSDVPEWALTAVKGRCDFCDPSLSGGCVTCFAWARLLTEADRRAYERGVSDERTRVLEWCDTLDGGPADRYTIGLVEHAVGEGEWPHGDTEEK